MANTLSSRIDELSILKYDRKVDVMITSSLMTRTQRKFENKKYGRCPYSQSILHITAWVVKQLTTSFGIHGTQMYTHIASMARSRLCKAAWYRIYLTCLFYDESGQEKPGHLLCLFCIDSSSSVMLYPKEKTPGFVTRNRSQIELYVNNM